MAYASLQECLLDLEKNGHLIRIQEEVDPHLEMATLHLKVFAKQGPALLFEHVKGTSYPCVSNLFGTVERSRFMFRDTFEKVQQLVQLRNNPLEGIKHPLKYASTAFAALKALPRKSSLSAAGFKEIKISDLPLITHWEMDGGAFVTLPQVYSEDIDKPGVMASNLGMYRIQLSGNDYELNKEIGLHYQLHRGIGVHQTKSNAKNQALKVSIFIGGPPSHTLAAVMPLPEGISELTFAGALGGKRFKYAYADGYCISLDADFVITGEVHPNDNKPEGPFGDHLGYYSLKHPFPVLKVHKVYAKPKGIWAFTVVGRPPQEDTAFGALIHDISGSAIPHEIPGVKEVHAVDAAGVHPLLLAVGSERYTPYLKLQHPSELLTQANHILGTGQLSLAKYLFIAADATNALHCHNIADFFTYVFERVNYTRDVHFYTKTSMDTLDYSGESINQGSKVVIAACGAPIRTLSTQLPDFFKQLPHVKTAFMPLNGVVMLHYKTFTTAANAHVEIEALVEQLKNQALEGIAQLVLYDDFETQQLQLNDYLWISYTRSNPSHDIYGVDSYVENKHWCCKGPLILDARKKPHHAPELKLNAGAEQQVLAKFKTHPQLGKYLD